MARTFAAIVLTFQLFLVMLAIKVRLRLRALQLPPVGAARTGRRVRLRTCRCAHAHASGEKGSGNNRQSMRHCRAGRGAKVDGLRQPDDLGAPAAILIKVQAARLRAYSTSFFPTHSGTRTRACRHSQTHNCTGANLRVRTRARLSRIADAGVLPGDGPDPAAGARPTHSNRGSNTPDLAARRAMHPRMVATAGVAVMARRLRQCRLRRYVRAHTLRPFEPPHIASLGLGDSESC
jgi:hypothetical protein